MRKITFLIITFFSLSLSFAQSAWTKADEEAVSKMEKVNRNSFPTTFQLFHLDLNLFKQQLEGAPVRGNFSGRSKKIIYLPNEEGNLERFYVMETPIMEADLARKFPTIKSYAAQGVDNRGSVARFSVTQFGLHNMTMTPGKSVLYIDPYTQNAENYIVYTKNSIANTQQSFECLTAEDMELPTLEENILSEKKINAADDSKLRTYRLALSCTGEYGSYFAGIGTVLQQKANVQAQMAITMTRVNGVYERDLAITMIFVADNDKIIYLDASTDPWIGEYNTKTAQTIDVRIGFSNYDIGHNFNRSGGGNAGCIGCVCSPTTSPSGFHKGRGYTGRANPTGDAFDIDYVAHEMGHQFGGYHTQSSRGCHSGSGTTEVEPGSASTIMGYAGICAPNVQSNSDAYFHYVTIRDITQNVKFGKSSSCAQISTFSNLAPVVNAGKDYNIPSGTPFMLTGSATDADGDVLTYIWEQNDPISYSNSNYATPDQFQSQGPLFRSLEGTTNPVRYFPAKETVLAGQTSSTWEVLPAETRQLNFSLTVRDNVAGGAQTGTDKMKVKVWQTTAPFAITSQNSFVSYEAGSNQNVTWNVGSSIYGAVDTQFVDIYMSSDNGNNFPILLASKVPNDGSEIITIPNLPGTLNRIMVKGYGNIFYDISNVPFSITNSNSSYTVAFSGIEGEQNKAICRGGSLTYTFPFTPSEGFNAPVNFSATNLPAGIAVTFTPASSSVATDVIMTLTSTTSMIPQVYTINVNASSGSSIKNVNLYANILTNTFSEFSLYNPANAAAVSTDRVDFLWYTSVGASDYELQIATDANFTNIADQTIVSETKYSSYILNDLQTYYWRVLPRNEKCTGEFSETKTFTTSFCGFKSSPNVPILIPNQVSTITSTITIDPAESVIISDLNLHLNIRHDYVSNLKVSITSPSGTIVELFSNKCDSKTDIDVIFDDQGEAFSCSDYPALSGNLTTTQAQALAAFNGQSSEGVWTLTIVDMFAAFGGQLNNWGISFCSPAPPLEVPKNEFSNLLVYPNPNDGNFNIQFSNSTAEFVRVQVYDMAGRTIFEKKFNVQGDFNENIELNTVQAGVYLVSIFDGERTHVKRIIIN